MGKRKGTKRSTAKKGKVGDLTAKKTKSVKGGSPIASFIPGLNPVVSTVAAGIKPVTTDRAKRPGGS